MKETIQPAPTSANTSKTKSHISPGFRKIVTGVALVFMCFKAGAELSESPDPNTLWILDGAAIKVEASESANHWSNRRGNIKGGANGELILESAEKNQVGRYLPFLESYPYLVLEITAITVPSTSSYRALSLTLVDGSQGDSLLGMVSFPEKGIFTLDTRFLTAPEHKTKYLQFYNYNCEVTVKNIRLVAKPENSLIMTSPAFETRGKLEAGDDLTFTVSLAEPCEDVTVNFYDGYTMPPIQLNGQSELQLKPTDASRKTWAATVKVESCISPRHTPDKPFRRGEFMAKAVVLGGKIDSSLWTANPCDFSVNPK